MNGLSSSTVRHRPSRTNNHGLSSVSVHGMDGQSVRLYNFFFFSSLLPLGVGITDRKRVRQDGKAGEYYGKFYFRNWLSSIGDWPQLVYCFLPSIRMCTPSSPPSVDSLILMTLFLILYFDNTGMKNNQFDCLFSFRGGLSLVADQFRPCFS